jgi:hypothetical protein
MIVFDALAAAKLYQDRTSKLLGYPASGVDIGNGVHVPPELSVTRWAHRIVEHPSGKSWAHPVVDPDKAGDTKLLTPAEVDDLKAKMASAVELDETWTPADLTAIAEEPRHA